MDGIFIATDVTIRKAVKLWADDEAKATKKYGHISTWATGNVTNMAFLFCVREEWMEHHTWDSALWMNEVYRRDLPYYKDESGVKACRHIWEDLMWISIC